MISPVLEERRDSVHSRGALCTSSEGGRTTSARPIQSTSLQESDLLDSRDGWQWRALVPQYPKQGRRKQGLDVEQEPVCHLPNVSSPLLPR